MIHAMKLNQAASQVREYIRTGDSSEIGACIDSLIQKLEHPSPSHLDRLNILLCREFITKLVHRFRELRNECPKHESAKTQLNQMIEELQRQERIDKFLQSLWRANMLPDSREVIGLIARLSGKSRDGIVNEMWRAYNAQCIENLVKMKQKNLRSRSISQCISENLLESAIRSKDFDHGEKLIKLLVDDWCYNANSFEITQQDAIERLKELSPRMQELAGLLYSRMARQQDGIQHRKIEYLHFAAGVLQQLQEQTPLNEETNGILAGIYKAQALTMYQARTNYPLESQGQSWDTEEKKILGKSLNIYGKAWAHLQSPYNGINYAAISLWLEVLDKTICDIVAEIEMALTDKARHAPLDAWDAMTLAEAKLIKCLAMEEITLDKHREPIEIFEQEVKTGRLGQGEIETSRDQALFHLRIRNAPVALINAYTEVFQ